MSREVYVALGALAVEEHAMVVEGRFDELAALDVRRAPLVAAVPERASPQDVDVARRAAQLQGLVTAALREACDAAGAQLARSAQAREGVRGYAGATGGAPPPAPNVDRAG
jgi:hypothetical protein